MEAAGRRVQLSKSTLLGCSVEESPRDHLMVWAVLFPYHFHHGMAGGIDKKKTIAQESTHSSAWSSREKKNSFSRQPLSQGHKGLGEILHWVMNFRNPTAKTALRKFPRKSKWTQEQAQTRNARTAADPISPKHMPSLLPPGSPPNSTTTPWSCVQRTPDPAVPCTWSTAGTRK